MPLSASDGGMPSSPHLRTRPGPALAGPRPARPPARRATRRRSRPGPRGRYLGRRWWIVAVQEIKARGYDLTARNPNRPEGERLSPPMEIVAGLMEKERKILCIIEERDDVLSNEETAGV